MATDGMEDGLCGTPFQSLPRPSLTIPRSCSTKYGVLRASLSGGNEGLRGCTYCIQSTTSFSRGLEDFLRRAGTEDEVVRKYWQGGLCTSYSST